MLKMYFNIFVFAFQVVLISGLVIVNPGPKYPPTKGEVWPQPQKETKETAYYTYVASYFTFTIPENSCKTLKNAVQRYSDILKSKDELRSRIKKNSKALALNDAGQSDRWYQGHIDKLKVILKSPCEEYPSFGMDEQCKTGRLCLLPISSSQEVKKIHWSRPEKIIMTKDNLTVTKVSRLESDSLWGIMRGLETFVQLFYFYSDSYEIRVNKTSIVDFPSYPHRGLLLDTSRHYITVGNLLKTLDAMAMNKMNVFHWHIVDDQSFPYQSERFPELSQKGAFHPSMVYTKKDIKRIVEYARVRGIRVIPEIDVPGHTSSWGVAYPDILTTCYSSDGKKAGLGPMDPLSEEALSLLRDLLAEVQDWFPDKYLHIGGDEVDLDCWNSNPRLKEYMKKHSMTAADLHTLFMENVIPLLNNNSKAIVWQEVFDENVPLSKDTLVQVWKSGSMIEMLKVLYNGHQLLFSSDWYLSHDVSDEWTDYYKWDPRQKVYNFITDRTLLSNIVGGEACLWGEMVDDRNVINRVWPRGCAVAENLWNSHPISWGEGCPWDSSKKIPNEAYYRLEEHACRMIQRGIDAQPPNGPGFCVM